MKYEKRKMNNLGDRGLKWLLVLLSVTGVLQADLLRDDVTAIVTDSATGLMWQDDVAAETTRRTWQEAIDYCEVLSWGGYNDWRLPNQRELLSIVDDSRDTPSIDTAVFQNTISSVYWSSTSYAGGTDSAWGIFFDYGTPDKYLSKNGSLYVRCIRGGQSETSPDSNILLISESPLDYALWRDTFTKQWTFDGDLTGYSVEVVSSDFDSYGTASINGDTVSINLTPDTSKVINTIILQLKDAGGNVVQVSGSDTFWAKIRTNTPPRLADGQSTQLVGGIGETLSMAVETFDGDNDAVTLSVKNSDGGTAAFSGNLLSVSFPDGETMHTVTITLNDGRESIDVDINVLRFDGTTIKSFYSDVDPLATAYDPTGIYFGTLQGVVVGQNDPSDPTQRIYRPTDDASLAEALAIVIGAAKEAGQVTMQTSNVYYDIFPRWAAPYYSFARNREAVDAQLSDLSVIYPTREQVAQMVVRTLGLDTKLAMFDALSISFSDEAQFSDETMKRYGQIAHFFGLFMEGSTARPQEPVSRAELATVIMNIFKMPGATVVPSATSVEFGETFSFNATGVVAQSINANPELYDSSADVTFHYAVNGEGYTLPNVDSSGLKIGTNTLYVFLDNEGVRNLVSSVVTVIYSDDDYDGIQNQYDAWQNDGRYSADTNGNGIPDILDSAYQLSAYSAEDSITVEGHDVPISQIIEEGYLILPETHEVNPAILNYLLSD